MNDVELLAQWTEELAKETRAILKDTTPEQLAWQPDPEANHIALTVWHVARAIDLVTVRALQNRPQADEQWWSEGWAQKYH